MGRLVKKYFPDGCPICGHEVVLEEEFFKYICYNCNAHADCHNKDTELVRKYQPSESMASNDTHVLRAEVRKNFSNLFRERRYIQGEHDMIGTSLINIVYPIHLVKEKLEDREVFYKVLARDENYITGISMDKGEITSLYKDRIEPASNRDKAMVFLAEKMGLDMVKVNIGYFTESQLKQSSEIIHAAVMDARRKSMETL